MNRDPELIDRIARQLEAELEELDAPTLARIQQARRRALTGQRRLVPSWRWPVAGLATAAVVALVVAGLWRPAPALLTTAQLEGLAVVTSAADLALYQELEFYAWLAQERNGDGS